MESPVIGPVNARERIQTIDIIRAFALFGVIVVNFTVDNWGTTPGIGRAAFWDQVAYWPIRFFMDDKAMATYCFLFGLGFAIQLVRAQERNAPVLFMFSRRIISLFLIGVIAFILTEVSVPHEYAMVAVLLLLFYKLPVKWLPVFALLCLLIPFTYDFIDVQKSAKKGAAVVSVDHSLLDSYAGVYAINPNIKMIIVRKGNLLVAEAPYAEFNLPAVSDSVFEDRRVGNSFIFKKNSTGIVDKLRIRLQNGNVFAWSRVNTNLQLALKEQIQKRLHKPVKASDYKGFIKYTWQEIWGEFKNWSWRDFFLGGDISGILSYFLIGLYAGKRKIFYNVSANKKFLTNVTIWGFIIGVMGMVINLGSEVKDLINGVPRDSHSLLTTYLLDHLWPIAVMATAFACIAGLTLLLENEKWKKRLSFLAPVGRMGFTNYMLQGFFGIALLELGPRLLDNFSLAFSAFTAIVIYVSFIFLSRWWFKYFLMGPVEWLWRSLTYWKLQPMKPKVIKEPTKPS